MRVVVFGAGGRTGSHVVKEALAADHQVVAFARTPEKIALAHPNLTVVQGDVRDAGQVEAAVAQGEAVISVLGPTQNRPDYQVSQGLGHILAAMLAHGLRRLVVSAGAGVRMPEDRPGLVDRIIVGLLKRFSRHVYEDMVRAVALVQAADLDWTIVRVPRLVDGPTSGQVRTGYVGQGTGMSLSRADLAAFLVQQLESETYLRQAPVIGN